MTRLMLAMLLAATLPTAAAAIQAPGVTSRNDSLVVRLVDVEVRTAVQALAPYLDRPVIVGVLPAARVTVEAPAPVPRSAVIGLLRGALDAHNLELDADSASGAYRVRPRERRAPAMSAPTATTAQAPGGRDQPELFVIRLRHAKASEVAATVNALYGRASALGEIGERPSPLSRSLQQDQAPPAPAPPGAAPAVSRNASFGGEVTIVPDSRANSLLVRASRTDYTLVEAAVTQLDVRPLQVPIEVLIAEVRHDRGLDVGVETKLPPARVRGSDNTTVQATTAGIGLGDFALKVMGIGGVDLEATIRAAASRGDATIVSRPVLLAANNERAEINVGSQRPFVQVSRVLPTDNTARDQVVQYKDVGTRLSVVPTISADGYVMLQVMQEVNAATAEQAFDAPVISTRSVETRLLVRDGQTIVLGGLTDRQREASQSGVPVLSSIPWVGALFGRVGRRNSQTELLLFLTPRVVRSDEEAEGVTAPMRRRAEEMKP